MDKLDGEEGEREGNFIECDIMGNELESLSMPLRIQLQNKF